MGQALQLVRQAQWRWDFTVASHGSTFHAPVEAIRILSHGLDRALQAQLALQSVLRDLGVKGEIALPDISTKAKAQSYIGLDMPAIQQRKAAFVEQVVPTWIQAAEQRHATAL